MLANIEALAAKKSVAEELWRTVTEEGLDSAVKQYHQLRSTRLEDYDFSEGELDELGFRLLGRV